MKGLFVALAVLATAGLALGEQRALRRNSGKLTPNGDSESGAAETVAQRLREDAQPQPTGSAADAAGVAVADSGEWGPLPSAEQVRAEAPKNDYMSKSELKEWRHRRLTAIHRSIVMANMAIERAQGAKATAQRAIDTADGNAEVIRAEQEAIKSADKAIERATAVKEQDHVRALKLDRESGKSAAAAESEEDKWARLHSEEEAALPKAPTGSAAAAKVAEEDEGEEGAKATGATGAANAGAAQSGDDELAENSMKLETARRLTDAEAAARLAVERRTLTRKLKHQTEVKLAKAEAEIRATLEEQAMDEIRETQERIKRHEARAVATKIKALEARARAREAEMDKGVSRAEREAESLRHEQEAKRLANQAREEAQFANSLMPTGATGGAGAAGHTSA